MRIKLLNKIFTVFIIILLSLIVPTNALANLENKSLEEKLANDLKQLGLFVGVSEYDFDLKRAPTRLESLAMLVRLLGKEDEAKNSNCSHPFTDVPSWADGYVGYAYENGLTKGVSGTL